MRLLIVASALTLAAAPLWAADGGRELQLKPKSAIATVPGHANAPFAAPTGEPRLDLQRRPDSRIDESASSCHSSRALCYDDVSGQIVYRASRHYMPEIPGLQPGDISIRRNRIILRYTF